LGSAFSVEQALLLKRSCKQGLLLMDDDEAGKKASLRAAILCEQNEIESRVAKLEEGKDPAELLQRGRLDLLTKSLNNANFSFDFLTNDAVQKERVGDPAGIKRICWMVFSYIDAVTSPVRREAYLNLLAGRLSLSPSAVGQEFDLFLQQNKGRSLTMGHAQESGERVNESANLPARAISPDYDAIYELYCAFLLRNDLYVQWKNQLAFLDLSSLGLSEVEHYLQTNNVRDDIMTFLQHGLTDSSIRQIFLDKIATAVHFDNDWQARVETAMRRLKIRALEKSRVEAIEALIVAEEQEVGIDIISDLQREVLLIDTELIEMKADSNE
jgi:DNA primase